MSANLPKIYAVEDFLIWQIEYHDIGKKLKISLNSPKSGIKCKATGIRI